MVWRASRERSWWLFAAGAVLAVVAVVLERWAGPAWALLGLTAASAVGGLLLIRVQAAAKQKDERAALLADSTRTLEESGRQETVRDVNLLRFGVHRAHVELDYVHPVAEGPLLALLNAGSSVLVVGHSMAGKTRTTAEVLREHFRDWPILLLTPPDGLSRLAAKGAQPERAVVWLDDLDRYLVGEEIRVEWLDRMRRRGNLVVATMRASEHARYQPDSQVRPPQAELLERFDVLRFEPDDASEREHLAAQVQDPGLREGIARYGLAEYVGGGYLAVHRFENARAAPHPKGHPLGVAMVRAAVDWRRVGLDVIPATSLAALAPMYLPERHRYDPGEDSATARAWATELVDGTMRLLEPADDHGGTRAFDYVLDYLSSGSSDGGSNSGSASDVPEHTWREAVASTPANRRLHVAYNAYDSGRLGYAHDLWHQAASDSEHPEDAPIAAVQLGILLEDQGQPDKAAAAYQQAIDSEDLDAAPKAAFCLGILLAEQGQPDKAAAAYQQAIDSEHPNEAPKAAFGLGILLEQQGQPDKAAAAYQQAIDSKHPNEAPKAAFSLGILLEQQGQPDKAAAAYQQAIDSKHTNEAPKAAVNLGLLLGKQGQPDRAAAAYQQAIDSEHPNEPSR